MKRKTVFIVFSVVWGVWDVYAIIYNIYYILNLPHNNKFVFFLHNMAFRYSLILLELIAILIFVSSKFTKSRLLQILLCWNIYSYFIPQVIAVFGINRYPFFFGLFSKITGATYFVCCCVMMYFLSKSYKPVIEEVEDRDATVVYQYVSASAWQRLAHRIIDIIVIISIVLLSTQYYNFINYDRLRDMGGMGLFILEVALIICYYLIFEVSFRITIGKLITSTLVVNDDGKKPTFGQMIWRTFCRFIPFDAFSFLSSSPHGWHDYISETYVVKAQLNTE